MTWDYTAQSYLDQLPPEEPRRIAHTLERLAEHWNRFPQDRLHTLEGGLAGLYAVRVGADLRVLLRRDDATVTVEDIVRQSQIKGFRRASREPAVATICRGP